MITLRGLTAIAALTGGFLLVMSGVAKSHDAAEWIQREQLKNRIGELCCGPRDCSRLEDGDVKPVSGGFLIQSTKEFVPTSEALPVSPDGYWICRWGGQRKCFIVPLTGF
jgi:hypothetical protein